MHGATVRASRLANQLLALAKAESAPQRGREHEIIDLLTIASAAARDWAPRAHATKIDLGFALEHADDARRSAAAAGIDRQPDRQRASLYAGRWPVTVTTGCDDDVPFLERRGHRPRHPRLPKGVKCSSASTGLPGTPGEGSGSGSPSCGRSSTATCGTADRRMQRAWRHPRAGHLSEESPQRRRRCVIATITGTFSCSNATATDRRGCARCALTGLLAGSAAAPDS